MKNESLYRKTVDILYDAYFNDTLQHNNCFACAVGNLVATNMGFKFIKAPRGHFYKGFIPNAIVWDIELDAMVEDTATYYCNYDILYSKAMPKRIINQIESTGYTIYQLSDIECAFESANRYTKSNDKDMFKGLVAVLEVLKEIHEVENNDTEVNKFKNHYQCKTQTLNT